MSLFTKKRAAETLIEVLIALFVLTIGGSAGAALVVSAMRSNLVLKDDLIAQNLAREGIEAVRNIRDTNWLRWSSNKELCWDLRDNSNCFNSPNLISTGPYRVGIDQGKALSDIASFEWTLEPHPQANRQLDLENYDPTKDDFYRLDIIDRFPTKDSDGDSNTYNDRDLYAHATTPNPTPNATQDNNSTSPAVSSKFYRMIYIVHSVQTDPIVVHSIVEWRQGSQVKKTHLSTVLTNYEN